MLFFFLSALFLTAAAVLWYVQAASRCGGEGADRGPSGGEPDGAEPDGQVVEELAAAADALRAVMEHPALGGPGFITVRLSGPEEEGLLTATAQYPNIREALYRRAVRRELEPEALLAEGMPEALLALSPRFETDSGGVVLISVQVSHGKRPEAGFRERRAVLEALAGGLRQKDPGLSVRCVGGELLLSPVREEERTETAHPGPRRIK